jgi:hypothetical protein
MRAPRMPTSQPLPLPQVPPLDAGPHAAASPLQKGRKAGHQVRAQRHQRGGRAQGAPTDARLRSSSGGRESTGEAPPACANSHLACGSCRAARRCSSSRPGNTKTCTCGPASPPRARRSSSTSTTVSHPAGQLARPRALAAPLGAGGARRREPNSAPGCRTQAAPAALPTRQHCLGRRARTHCI